ncbi:carbohydrate ABC transporter permease [Paenibacillus sp. J5C_2022]|uniref:carbohydrate ABC transporter permease n=1 Tax=Paenibacillus sp. J5C2022 TaxID=2977129 RepID=UPI0021D02E11|nr:carbohydrate ABC transporter permease [Paenibacillus sp. J5C2022]MCU6712795.1 carbohydrate ABC transporter permease [Paenibacillus sp. J5C2022]
MRKRLSLFSLVNLAVMLVVIAVTLFPFLHMAAISLSHTAPVLKGEVGLWPKGLNFGNYELVLKDPRILQSYMNTLIYTALYTTIALITTGLGAYALSKKAMPFHRGFTILIVITMFFNGGMIPTFLVVKELHLIDTLWGMVLPGAVSTWYLMIMRTFFQAMPAELEESGKLDGLTDIGLFIRIIAPLSKPVFATIGMFYAVSMWNNFQLPLLYLRDPDLFPLQVVLRNIVLVGQMNGTDAMGIGGDQMVVEESLKYATIMVATIPILLIYPFLQKHFVKGVMIGAIKG